MKSQRHSHAFSLIEVMIVLAILGLLASIAVPKYQAYLDKGKYKTSQLNLQKIAEAFELYHSEKGKYPSFNSWQELSAANSPLNEYMNEVPKTDKWDRPYEVKSSEQDYRLGGKAIPRTKLAGAYPDYVFLPGPVMRTGTTTTSNTEPKE